MENLQKILKVWHRMNEENISTPHSYQLLCHTAPSSQPLDVPRVQGWRRQFSSLVLFPQSLTLVVSIWVQIQGVLSGRLAFWPNFSQALLGLYLGLSLAKILLFIFFYRNHSRIFEVIKVHKSLLDILSLSKKWVNDTWIRLFLEGSTKMDVCL